MSLRQIIAFLLLLLLAFFVVMNLETARVWFFGIRAEMPIAILVLVAGGLGLAAGVLLAFVQKKRGKSTA